MESQERALREYACGESVVFSKRGKPAVGPVVMDVGIDLECDKHVTVEQPDHDSSSSASARRTVSAVIGFLP